MLAFFRSEASGPARRMDSLIAHLSRKERARLRVTVVDVDCQSEIAQRFRVTTVPTLILIDDRQVVARLEGRVSAPRIDRMLAPYLGEARLEVGLTPAPAVG